MKSSSLGLGSSVLLVLACGSNVQRVRPDLGASAVIVLDQSILAQLTGRSVIDAIKLRVPQVRAGSGNGCPSVVLRGTDRLQGGSNPDVYVDHAHALDTCVLASLWAIDVDRIEIYPLGVTSRPGYATAAHGLILVFTRGSLAR